ncbi:MAG: hypothetical protein HQK54_07605 [Oligoflexales bacterium]|nr:hypothetical protein [Oligoflexales bacterium]
MVAGDRNNNVIGFIPSERLSIEAFMTASTPLMVQSVMEKNGMTRPITSDLLSQFVLSSKECASALARGFSEIIPPLGPAENLHHSFCHRTFIKYMSYPAYADYSRNKGSKLNIGFDEMRWNQLLIR